MRQRITCTQTIQVGSALQRSVSTVLEVDAYDVIEVSILDGASDEEVEVQPGSDVRLLMIVSDAYDAALTYKVNAIANDAHALDQPQVFAGTGAMGLLDAAAPGALFFSNASGQDVLINIVVGRNV